MCIRDRVRFVQKYVLSVSRNLIKVKVLSLLAKKFVESLVSQDVYKRQVMNPVDHPMGGGEGRASGGHPRSRTGVYAKGLKTRAPKKQSSKYMIERRK